MSLVGGSVRISWVGVWLVVVGSSRNTTEASGCWWGGVGGLLFVNYIVDASIFERRAFYDRYLVTASVKWWWVWWWVCGVYF